MAEYIVSLDNEEVSEKADNLSITGRVDGVQSAVVIRRSSISALDKKAQTVAKRKALVWAFLNRQKTASAVAGEKVEV